MTTTLVQTPTFHQAQKVIFAGGEGFVRGYKPEASGWTDLIEMVLGIWQSFGRIGAETRVFLNEVDLRAA